MDSNIKNKNQHINTPTILIQNIQYIIRQKDISQNISKIFASYITKAAVE